MTPTVLRSAAVGLLAIGLSAVGCNPPTERDDAVFLTLEVGGKAYRDGQVLIRGNRLTLTARAWRRTGDRDSVEAPNVAVEWRSSRPADATVAASAHRAAEVTGIRASDQPVVITAVAIGFEAAAPAVAPLRIADILEVDSIRPRQVKYGQQLTVFGVGVDQIGLATLAGGQLLGDTTTFQGNRGGVGRAKFWVPPPAGSDRLLAIGPGVFVASDDSVHVLPQDIYEPNDASPWILPLDLLRPIPSNPFLRVANPALAFEDLRSDTLGYDWYRFTTDSATEAFTFVIDPPGSGGGSRTMMGSPNQQSGPPNRWNWLVSAGQLTCRGASIFPRSAPQNQHIFAFKRLVSSGIDLVSEYQVEGAVTMVVVRGYLTQRADVGPDRFEENDICDFADLNFANPSLRIDLQSPFADTLTFDNPGDVDWFRVRVPGAGNQPLSIRAFSPAAIPQNFQADFTDLGLFVLTAGPTPQLVAAAQKRDDSQEDLAIVVPPGDYYVVAMDQGGAPARYGLCVAVGATCTIPAVAAIPAFPATRSTLDRILGGLEPGRAAGRPAARGRVRR
ncbi:MAG: hypothetical protein ACKVZ0_17270 [Gemmatimonadales bacterium]